MPRSRRNKRARRKKEDAIVNSNNALPLMGFGIYAILIVAFIFLLRQSEEISYWGWVENLQQNSDKWLTFTSACTIVFSFQVKYRRSTEQFPLEDFGILIAGLAAFAVALFEIEPIDNAEGLLIVILAIPIVLMSTLRWHPWARVLVFVILVSLVVLLSGKAVEVIEISVFVLYLLAPIVIMIGILWIIAKLHGNIRS